MNVSVDCLSNAYLQVALEFNILFLRKCLSKQEFKIFKEWFDDKSQIYWFEPEKQIERTSLKFMLHLHTIM